MVGVGIIGCGRIGRMHARNVHAHAEADLLACYDVADAAAAATAAELGIVQAASVDELLADARIRAVLIASSTDTHVGLIARCARAGKAVFCEKPVDLNIERVDACWRSIAELDPMVMIGFNRRFDPSFKALRDRVAAGEVGRVEQVVITSRDPSPPPAQYLAQSGGLFRDMTIHDFDMARYLVGDIIKIHAFGANLIDPAVGATGDVDAAMLIMRAASGALVHINNSRRCSYGYDQRVEMFGALGMLQVHNRHLTTIEAWGGGRTRAMDPVQDFFITRYAEAYSAEFDHFIGCVATGVAPMVSFADGRAALQLADAALESMASGRTVSLD